MKRQLKSSPQPTKSEVYLILKKKREKKKKKKGRRREKKRKEKEKGSCIELCNLQKAPISALIAKNHPSSHGESDQNEAIAVLPSASYSLNKNPAELILYFMVRKGPSKMATKT